MAIIYESTILNFLWIARFLCNTLKDAFKLHTFSLICTAGRLSNPNHQVEYCPPPELALADMAILSTELIWASPKWVLPIRAGGSCRRGGFFLNCHPATCEAYCHTPTLAKLRSNGSVCAVVGTSSLRFMASGTRRQGRILHRTGAFHPCRSGERRYWLCPSLPSRHPRRKATARHTYVQQVTNQGMNGITPYEPKLKHAKPRICFGYSDVRAIFYR